MGMMDLRERKSLREEDMSENKKCCTDCKTTKTPLWRGGPAGPKSLCNACGIRYRKKRRAMMMPLDDRPAKKRDRSQSSTNTTNTATSITSSTTNTANTVVTDKGPNGNGLSGSLKIRFMVLGNEVVLQRSSSPIVKKQRCKRRKKLGEEEQAAFCLMALSSGSVFA